MKRLSLRWDGQGEYILGGDLTSHPAASFDLAVAHGVRHRCAGWSGNAVAQRPRTALPHLAPFQEYGVDLDDIARFGHRSGRGCRRTQSRGSPRPLPGPQVLPGLHIQVVCRPRESSRRPSQQRNPPRITAASWPCTSILTSTSGSRASGSMVASRRLTEMVRSFCCAVWG